MARPGVFEVLNLKDPQLRKFGWYIALGVLGIALLVIPGMWSSGRNASEARSTPAETAPESLPTPTMTTAGTEIAAVQAALEQSVADILGQVRGVGKVAVRVTVRGSGRVLYERDTTTTSKTTEEQDGQGGTRVITEETQAGQLVLVRTEGTGESPVITRITQPDVAGVLVVAEGARDSRVKSVLTEAVLTLLQVAPHQVHVLPMEGGD